MDKISAKIETILAAIILCAIVAIFGKYYEPTEKYDITPDTAVVSSQ